MKPAIITLSIIGLVGIVVGIFLFIAGTAAVLAQCQSVLNDQALLNACVTANASQGAGQILGGTLLFVIGILCGIVGWILGIVKAATAKAGGWIVVAIIPVIGSLIYGLAGPMQPKQQEMAGPSMYQPPYQQ